MKATVQDVYGSADTLRFGGLARIVREGLVV
jgi:hypothetical protein